MVHFWLDFGKIRGIWVGSRWSVEHGVAVEVVGEVGESGFEACAGDADASDVVAAEVRDAPEDVFDAGSGLAFEVVDALLIGGQRTARFAFFVDKIVDLQGLEVFGDGLARVGTVGPKRGASVGLADECFQGL